MVLDILVHIEENEPRRLLLYFLQSSIEKNKNKSEYKHLESWKFNSKEESLH